jgi:Uri superfamily endonuclease
VSFTTLRSNSRLTPLRAGVVMLVRIPYIQDMDITPDFLYETVYVYLGSCESGLANRT